MKVRKAVLFAEQVSHRLKTPKTYTEAMRTTNARDWKKAYDDEMSSVKYLNVYQVVDTPLNKKPNDTKWVFKFQEDEVGNVNIFKAHRVVKGYIQTFGVD